MKYNLNNPKTNWSENSYIIIEKPHQGKAKIWTAMDDQDLIEKINSTAQLLNSDTSSYNMTTTTGCLDWNAHDLSYQTVYKQSDKDLIEVLNYEGVYSELIKAALYLEWVKEIPLTKD